jgi:hypothetical protein
MFDLRDKRYLRDLIAIVNFSKKSYRLLFFVTLALYFYYKHNANSK